MASLSYFLTKQYIYFIQLSCHINNDKIRTSISFKIKINLPLKLFIKMLHICTTYCCAVSYLDFNASHMTRFWFYFQYCKKKKIYV